MNPTPTNRLEGKAEFNPNGETVGLREGSHNPDMMPSPEYYRAQDIERLKRAANAAADLAVAEYASSGIGEIEAMLRGLEYASGVGVTLKHARRQELGG